MADAAATEPASNLQQDAGQPAAAEAAAKKKTAPKRKVAMHMAYLGAGYHGMQRNPGFPTIEAELETALVKAGAISDQNAGSFMKIHWMRAARTDKGVSAVCQVVSAKLITEPQDTFVERVNALLPKQIRVFGVQRATDGFDARKFCDKRKYEYIMPAWAFDPEVCQGRSSRTAAAAAAAKAAAKPDPAAALKAVAAAVLAAPAAAAAVANSGNEGMTGAAAGGSSSSAGGAEQVAAAAGGDEADASAADNDGDDDVCAADASGVESAGGGVHGSKSNKVPDVTASTSNLGNEKLQRLRSDIAASRSRFVFGPEQLQRLNQVLGQYQGTHNFHNYTVRVNATDPAATRYILSFTAELLHIGGSAWVKMVVIGQSFMLHQIRKMVGMAVAVMRGVAPEPTLTLALDPDRDFTTPMAPELGLFLDETYFDAYNKKFGHLHGPVTFEPFRSGAEAFKAEVLYPHIAARDEQDLINALWLCGCTNAYYKFTRWASWPSARDTAAALARSKERAAADKVSSRDQQQQQGKRRQAPAAAAGAAAANGGGSAAGAGDGAGEQPAAKQQRLERPGRLQGATAAMVLGMQETYGMSPHRDTVKASQARQELKEMRQEFQQQQQQQEKEKIPEADPAELDSLYDMM